MKRESLIALGVGGISVIALIFLFGEKYSKQDTAKYYYDCMSAMSDAKKSAESSWTTIGAVSDMNKGFDRVIAYTPKGNVDPVVIMKMRHWADRGKVYFDEMDGEIASFSKGLLAGAALALDFSGVTWGASSVGTASILFDDHDDEVSAESDFNNAMREMRIYLYEKGYID